MKVRSSKEKFSNWLADKWSFSKASCFTKCPRLFFYKYVMRMRETVTPALLFGRGAHGGQETDNYAKVRGDALTVEQVLDAAVAELEFEGKKESVAPEVDDFVVQHTRQLGVFESSGERAKVVPIPGSIEAGFEVELEVGTGDEADTKTPALLEGFVDVVSLAPDGTREVVNYKTTGKPASPAEVVANVQLAAEAVGAEAGAAKIVSFVKHVKQKPTTKVSAAVPTTQARWERALGFLANAINGARAALKSGSFPKCDPHSHWCNPKVCSFYGMCYPEKDPNIGKFVELKVLRPVGTVAAADWRKSHAATVEASKEALLHEGQ